MARPDRGLWPHDYNAGSRPPPVRLHRLDWRPVVRSLSPDEVAWFVSRAVAFLGHSDPRGLSQRLAPRLRDAASDAARCFVYAPSRGEPSAGVYVRAPGPDDDDATLTLVSPWHVDDPEGLRRLVGAVLERFPHEAAVAALHGVPPARARELQALLAPLGFVRDEVRRVRFELSEVPPLGRPLVLEAWSLRAERAFRDLFERAEARQLSDEAWAYLKRRHAPFRPDLWFMARETLDQEPVGYALCGARGRGFDAAYVLNGIGVLQEHRRSSEMLRRLVVSVLQELAALSPFGTVEAELSASDPKLIDILRSVGFVTVERYAALVRMPL